jgi:hypothetical protein
MRRLAFVGLLASVVLVAGCASAGKQIASSPTRPRPQGASLETTVHHATSRSVPRWAQTCLPKGRQRLGPAPKYVGLTFAAGQRLENSPVFAGGGGRCSYFNDDVYRTHPIAVVYSAWNPHERKARIIAAVRAVAGWQSGN